MQTPSPWFDPTPRAALHTAPLPVAHAVLTSAAGASMARLIPSALAVALSFALLLPMQPARADEGAQLAGTCTGCHGTNGNTIGDALPSLAGQPKAALLASLKGFKSGERSATVMTQIAKGYSDEQIERIATFFAAQKPQPKAGTVGAAGAAPESTAAGASAVPRGSGS